jgi:Domain of unknown function (DUF4397)
MATLCSHPAKSLARLVALGLVLAGLPGCQNIQTTATDTAQIRFIDASPDPIIPGIDIYQNASAVAYNLGFGTITSYVPMTQGPYTFSAYTAGSRQTLIAAKQTLVVGKQYTAIVGNNAANLQETILTDQSTPAPAGEVSVRFIDQATRAGAVDIYLVPSTGKLLTSSPLATGVVFTGNTGYINVPAGTYAIAVVPAGTVPVSTTVTLLTGAQIAYSGGAVRTVVLIDGQIVTTPAVQAIIANDYDLPTAL